MHQYKRYFKNVTYCRIMVVSNLDSKFGAYFTIGRLVIEAFVTFSGSLELCNVVLLVVKALSFRQGCGNSKFFYLSRDK